MKGANKIKSMAERESCEDEEQGIDRRYGRIETKIEIMEINV